MSGLQLVVALVILVQCGSVVSNEDGICGSLDLRNNITSLERLRGCRVIEGSLRIVLMNHKNMDDFSNISFPELREITHFLLVYHVKHLKSLGSLFPNLAVIRGLEQWVDSSDHYSLMVYDMPDLQELGLASLTNILSGSVRIEKNSNMCFVDTIDWNRTMSGSSRLYDRDNYKHCVDWNVCKESKCSDERCWEEGKCQLDPKNLTVPGTGESCHPECLGGCTGPEAHQCHVCRRVLVGGTCKAKCSASQFEFMGRRCLTEDQCRNQKVPEEKEKKSYSKWIPFNGSCILDCPVRPFQKDEAVTYYIRNINDIQRFRRCTQINGNLTFILTGSNNLTKDLIDGFGLVEIIRGQLAILRSPAIYSLNFMPYLHTIIAAPNQPAIVINGNQNLGKLWDWNHRERQLDIKGGRLQIHDNPRLCKIHIKELMNITGTTNLTKLEYTPESNGYDSVCDNVTFQANSSSVNSTTVLIEWGVIDECINGSDKFLIYQIFYMKMSSMSEHMCGDSGWQVDYLTVNITDYVSKGLEKLSHIITDLEEFQQYAYYVKVYCSDNGKRSPLTNFTTLPGTPSEPQYFCVRKKGNEDFLKWKAPLYPRGNITHYIIYGILMRDDLQLLDYCHKEISDKDFSFVEKSQEEDKELNCSSCTAQEMKTCSKTEVPKSIHSSCTPYAVDKLYSYFHNLIRVETMKLSNSTIENVTISYADELFLLQYISYNTVDFVVNQTVPVWENSFVLENLNHYSIYTFGIKACGFTGTCSPTVLTKFRTRYKENADDIDSDSVVVSVEKWGTNISWESPKEPNGVILKYKLKYRRTDIQNFHPIEICVPLTKENRSRMWYNITNLMPGEYTVQVQAVSLYRPGAYTSTKDFSITFSSAVNKTTSLIIGIFALVITLLGLSIIISIRFWKQKRDVMITTVNPEYIGLVKYVPDEWEISRDKVQLIREISQGSFGMVYEGILQPCNTRCAVKTVAETASTVERVEFLNEACIMKQFSEGHHIVRLLGVVSKGQPPMVVMELMERGDLKNFLRSARDVESEEHSLLSCTYDYKKIRNGIDIKKILIMAAEIADGMAYLEACKFVHRDLAARNCMIAQDLTVKVGDFGMARDVYENDYYRKGSKGLLPVRWMAPESLSDGVFTSQSDVWSFGIVLWEIATLAEQPYQGMTNEQVLYFVKEGGTLPKPEIADTIMYDLMCACWQQQPFSRPTFMQIVASLEILTGSFGATFEEVSFYHSEMGQRERHELQPESAEDDALLSNPLSSLQNSNNLLTRNQRVYANIHGNHALRPHSQHMLDS